MGEPKILVVEDEPSFADALTVGLTREGFDVTVAPDGGEALRLFESEKPDLVLLDLMLPVLSGIDVCREMRSTSTVPIIMVTAKGEELDTVVGLEVGADDYVTKPYRLRELIARIRALLRRSEITDGPQPGEAQSERIVLGGVTIDTARHEVIVRGTPQLLPRKEFELLALLMRNAGHVLTRNVLIERVWGHDYVGDTKTLDVHINRIRDKVEADPKSPELIVTIRGVGYKFAD